MKSVAKQLAKIVDGASEQIQRLADEYRLEVVVPYCRRHRITFTSGMGSWSFYDDDGPIFEEHLPGNSTKMVDVLNEEALSRDDIFGFYISDVNERDWERNG